MLRLDWLGPSLDSSVRGRVGPGDSGTRGATWVREEKFPKREGEHHLQKTGWKPQPGQLSGARVLSEQRKRWPQDGHPPEPKKTPEGASCTIRGPGNTLSKVSPGTAMQRRLSVCWSLVDLTPQPGAPLSRLVGTGSQKRCVCVTLPYLQLIGKRQVSELNLSDIRWGTLNSTKAALPMWLNTKHGNMRACCGLGFHPETRKAEGSEVSNRDI